MKNIRMFFVCLLVVLMSVAVFSAEKVIKVVTDQKTNLEVPYVMSFSELLDLVGEDFDANWYSIRVKDSNGKDLPYQLVDVDKNGKISSKDLLQFTFKKEAKLVVSDDWDLDLLQFAPSLKVEEKDGEYIVSSDKFTVKVNSYGLASFVKFNNAEG